MLTVEQLRVLQEAVRFQSFAAAGRALGFSTSAISQHISTLERSTGLVLFERGPKSVRATRSAKVLADRADGLLSDLVALELQAQALAAGQQGVLRVGSFPSASARVLPAAMTSFAAAYPRAVINLDEDEADVLMPRLLSGELDLALAYRYDFVPWDCPQRVQASGLLDEPMRVLLSRDRASRFGNPVHLADLANEPWIAPKETTFGAQCLLHLCRNLGFSPQVTMRSNSYEVMRSLVQQDLGVALVSSLGHAPSGQVVARPLKEISPIRHVMALRIKGNNYPLAENFMEHLRAASYDVERDIAEKT